MKSIWSVWGVAIAGMVMIALTSCTGNQQLMNQVQAGRNTLTMVQDTYYDTCMDALKDKIVLTMCVNPAKEKVKAGMKKAQDLFATAKENPAMLSAAVEALEFVKGMVGSK